MFLFDIIDVWLVELPTRNTSEKFLSTSCQYFLRSLVFFLILGIEHWQGLH